MIKITIILQIAATLVMTGVIWVIQLVQYPFFSEVNAENFPKYHAAHTFWITPIVAPAMLVELFTSILLVFFPPAGIDHKLLWFGLILTGIVWASTFFLQIPLHNKLALGFDPNAHTALVSTNWIRTAAWSLRGVLVIYLAWKLIRL